MSNFQPKCFNSGPKHEQPQPTETVWRPIFNIRLFHYGDDHRLQPLQRYCRREYLPENSASQLPAAHSQRPGTPPGASRSPRRHGSAAPWPPAAPERWARPTQRHVGKDESRVIAASGPSIRETSKWTVLYHSSALNLVPLSTPLANNAESIALKHRRPTTS